MASNMDQTNYAHQARAIECLLLGFDFSQAQAVMQLMRWTWGDDIPTVSSLRDMARQLLSDLANDPTLLSTDSGALRAERVDNGDGMEFRLTFEALTFSVGCEVSESSQGILGFEDCADDRVRWRRPSTRRERPMPS
jgi:hypothetical protein